MSYQVLARKWRPRNFQDVFGQEHITRSLQNALLKDRIGHAYIMTGTRGIGKTSVARIFGKALRCEALTAEGNPCHECKGCTDFDLGASLNVIEIDGASNNSVDDIRDLINKVHTLPTFGKYKVYIIDEIHMLSTNAFNALLKTLEEPPEHVIFIFATTEPHKLLSTVLSRCQRFDFRNASSDVLLSHLKTILKEEGIDYEGDYVLETLATQGNGSFRDTLSLLEQVLSFSIDGRVTEAAIGEALGLAKTTVIFEMIEELLSENHIKVSNLFREMLSQNITVENIAKSLFDGFYEILTHIDEPKKLLAKGFKGQVTLESLSMPEVFWIYETLVQDSKWALESIYPDKVYELLLKKLTLRREILSAEPIVSNSEVKKKAKKESTEPVVEKAIIEEKEVIEEVVVAKKVAVAEIKPVEVERKPIKIDIDESILSDNPPVKVEEEVEEKIEETKSEEKPKEIKKRTWDDFVIHLKTLAPASASNLEQGNLLHDPLIDEDKVTVEIGFGSSSKVFFDYVSESETREKLLNNINSYFEVGLENISLNISFIDDKTKKETNFKSVVEIEDDKHQVILKEKEERLLQNPLLQEAQSMFNTKIDKVKVNDK